MPSGFAQLPDKTSWRALLLQRRREVPAALRSSESHQLAAGAAAAGELIDGGGAHTVCAYVPIRNEPGSLAMLDALRAAGHDVLLPIVPTSHSPTGPGPCPTGPCPTGPCPGALGWARYLGADSLVTRPGGPREPTGPDLGPAAISEARLVLVPALAVDRRGVRLGRGAGWYDRTLPLARPGIALLAVVRDDEVVDALPHEPHDVLMTGVLTPRGGLRALPLT
ncbi:MAG: 5-formyltetrahydrofolate cyclo-ligase [Actinomycetota bacterium]|nr:5-formyltetrahydrofolate cyclo-ligase [Actinomycetota bacterium]